MHKHRVKLRIDIVLKPIEQRERIISPLRENLKGNGVVYYHIPNFRVKLNGDIEYEPLIIDIVFNNFITAIAIVKKVLENENTERGRPKDSCFGASLYGTCLAASLSDFVLMIRLTTQAVTNGVR